MTAMVILYFSAYSVILRTSCAKSTNFPFSTREQLGQAMMFRPSKKFFGTDLNLPSSISCSMERPTAISSPLSSSGTVRDTRMVSPIPAGINCSNAISSFYDAFGGHSRFGDPQMQGHIRPLCSKTLVCLDHFLVIRILERNTIIFESQIIQ